jgi:hypothetical protein
MLGLRHDLERQHLDLAAGRELGLLGVRPATATGRS